MALIPRDAVVTLRMTTDQRNALIAAAEEAGVSLSSYTAKCLAKHLIRTGRVPAPPKAPRRTEDTADSAA